MSDIKRWRAELQRWGVWRFVHSRIMNRLKPWLTVCRVHMRIQDAEAAPPPPLAGVRVGIASRDELMSAANDPEMGLRAADVDAALSRGDICAAAFKNNQMVAYVWRSFSTAPHGDGLWVAFERPYRYGYKMFTHPDFRGQHLQEAIGGLTDTLCIERGYPRSISFVETHNYASIATDMRRGNTRVGWAGYLKLFGHVYPFRSSGARRHTFRFVMHSRKDLSNPDRMP